MLVPRSFKYSSSPPREMRDTEKVSGPETRKAVRGARVKSEYTPVVAIAVTRPAATETTRVPTRPMNVPVPDARMSGRSASSGHAVSGNTQRPGNDGRRSQSDSLSPQTHRRKGAGTVQRQQPRNGPAHRPDALSPSVAALLAMTAIPPPKPHQLRRRRNDRKLSIDELVNSWKSDVSLGPVFSSSPSLSILLETACDTEDDNTPNATPRRGGRSYTRLRSTSTESMPSLDTDDRSLRSTGSPSTPGSLRSRRSLLNLRKESLRSLPNREDCALDHPLAAPEASGEDDDMLFIPITRTLPSKPKASFKSNLTSSLQALKAAAISSLSALTSADSGPRTNGRDSLLADDMLWSHPFLFPRLSSEIRPEIRGTPTQAQRRYLNPHPLTFEEQEAPFQQALHEPYLKQANVAAPSIPLQTYSRSRTRSASPKRGSADPASEAGRVGNGVRQREPRENSDFLRMVVLEMNMRREGKLEIGKAKIWLAPRKDCAGEDEPGRARMKVPKRWVGVSA